MWVVWIILALIAYAAEIYLVHKYGNKIDLKLFGRIVRIPSIGPRTKLLLEPFLWMFVGLVFVVGGVIGTSPIWLLIIGQPVIAMLAFLIIVAISTQTKINYTGPRLSFDNILFRTGIGVVACLVGGVFVALAGALMSAPILFILLSIF